MKDGKGFRVVIETMGCTDDDYCERKAEQHKGMRQIGLLQTDPPGGHRKLRRLSKGISLVFFIISENDVVILSKQTRFVYSLPLLLAFCG